MKKIDIKVVLLGRRPDHFVHQTRLLGIYLTQDYLLKVWPLTSVIKIIHSEKKIHLIYMHDSPESSISGGWI